MPKIFISYRRSDSAYVTSRIRDSIEEDFGPGSAVIDIDSIPLGADFRTYVASQIRKSDVLLVVIGDRWLEILKERDDDDHDLVRTEIKAALDRDIPVIPVLVDRASVPSEHQLPEDLAPLAFRNAAEVRSGRDEKNHLQRLNTQIQNLVPLPFGNLPHWFRRRLYIHNWRPAVIKVSVIGVSVILLIAFWKWIGTTDPASSAAYSEPPAQESQSEEDDPGGKIVQKAPVISLDELASASDSGDIEAQYELAIRYEVGNGGAVRDIGRALRWYRTAAINDHPRACYRLGMLYFDGSLLTKDLMQAEKWFRKAVEIGDRDAASMMGHLYETGVVVEKDLSAASDWYSASMGISPNEFVVDPSKNNELTVELPAGDELRRLATLSRYRSRTVMYTDGLAPTMDAGGSGNSLFATALSEALRSNQKILTGSELAMQVRKVFAPKAGLNSSVAWAKMNGFGAGDFVFLPRPDKFEDATPESQQLLRDFGSYFALIIANEAYELIPNLTSPISDAQLVQSTLEERYGFEVRILTNATNEGVLSQVYDLRSRLGENDNLIIYYAGHGVMDAESNQSYWLGVDADPESPEGWISTNRINDMLDLIQAKNVMILSDAFVSVPLIR